MPYMKDQLQVHNGQEAGVQVSQAFRSRLLRKDNSMSSSFATGWKGEEMGRCWGTCHLNLPLCRPVTSFAIDVEFCEQKCSQSIVFEFISSSACPVISKARLWMSPMTVTYYGIRATWTLPFETLLDLQNLEFSARAATIVVCNTHFQCIGESFSSPSWYIVRALAIIGRGWNCLFVAGPVHRLNRQDSYETFQ